MFFLQTDKKEDDQSAHFLKIGWSHCPNCSIEKLHRGRMGPSSLESGCHKGWESRRAQTLSHHEALSFVGIFFILYITMDNNSNIILNLSKKQFYFRFLIMIIICRWFLSGPLYMKFRLTLVGPLKKVLSIYGPWFSGFPFWAWR